MLGASTFAQAQTTASDEHKQMPTYSVNEVSRTTRAVKYAHRGGSTRIDFLGTSLMPGVTGEATVASKRGAMAIEVEFRGLAGTAIGYLPRHAATVMSSLAGTFV